TGGCGTDMMSHAARPGRKQSEVHPPFFLDTQLVGFQRFPYLIVMNDEAACRDSTTTFRVGGLPGAKVAQSLRRGRVVTMAVDDHESSQSLIGYQTGLLGHFGPFVDLLGIEGLELFHRTAPRLDRHFLEL